MLAEAIDEFRKADVCSSGSPVMRAWLGHACALAGDIAEARRIARELAAAGTRRECSAIQAEVERLLAAHEQAGSFLNAPMLDIPAAVHPHGCFSRSQLVGDRFEIIDRIGAGGMGEVYK